MIKYTDRMQCNFVIETNIYHTFKYMREFTISYMYQLSPNTLVRYYIVAKFQLINEDLLNVN